MFGLGAISAVLLAAAVPTAATTERQHPFFAPSAASLGIHAEVAQNPVVDFHVRYIFTDAVDTVAESVVSESPVLLPTAKPITQSRRMRKLIVDAPSVTMHGSGAGQSPARLRRTIASAVVPVRSPVSAATTPISFFSAASDITSWQRKDLIVPDMTDNTTVITLAKMTYNAYVDPANPLWYDLDPLFRINSTFGMNQTGMRGYVFADSSNSTFVIAIKGTSASFVWGDGGITAPKDKAQDNTLFSCCCARVDYSWTPVCGCYMNQNFCNQTCLEQSVVIDDMYYNTAMDIFLDIERDFPDAAVWLTGHSLGGAVSSLVGLTFGLPTVAFQAPGDKLPGRRLHLPQPPGIDWKDVPVWHVGHDADPIYTGTCVGARSSCYYAGFAMEAKCHMGRTCVYNVMEKWGWKSDIRTHRIWDVIERVLVHWDGVPSCTPEEECTDCALWQFIDA